MKNKMLGQYGESLAARFLENKGHRILEKNFKNKIGEIDLITKDGAVVCFIEVKTRRSLSCGMPYESVHQHKQRKLIQVALSYLKYKFGTVDVSSRFDVVSIYKDVHDREHIEHIPNAFDLD